MPLPFRRAACALLPLLALTSAQLAKADTTCVNTAAALQAALAAAQTNNNDDYIKVVAGNYSFATSLSTYISDHHALILEGGYAPGCASLTPVADNTIISGANGTYFRQTSDGGGVIIRNFAFTGFKPAAGTNAIVFGQADSSATQRLENLAIYGNGVNGINDSIALVYSYGGLVFDNNVVHDNTNAVAAVKVSAQYPGHTITLANNTIAKNVGPGLVLDVYSLEQTGLYNNVLWNPGTTDLTLTTSYSSTSPLALNNVWLTCLGCGYLALGSNNNITSNPNLSATFRLNAGSPAINSGVPAPHALSALDAAGSTRIVGSAPDRGAYETSTNDLASTTYLVTSTADDGSILSLRGAITAANAAGVPARINFHLSAGCPAVIVLNSPLPPIKVPMILDGYYDPNSTPNILAVAPTGAIPSNASICPVLFGAFTSPSVANALSVAATADPKVHLEVRGLRFQNFATAIDLSGGNGHWIHGNAFVGPFFSGVLGNGIGVTINSGFADVIGGPAVGDVNLLGGSSGEAAVVISGGVNQLTNGMHVVTNNSIGGDPAGTGGSYKNTNAGVELINTSQTIVGSNWIVSNGGDGVRIDNSDFIVARNNRIGAPALGNLGAGVHVLNGASKNWIGTTDVRVTGDGNDIYNNVGPGVWIDQTAGTYNQVTNNSIFSNGGIAIDLGAAGPTANTGGENSGPNVLLHKPYLTSAVYTAGSNIKVYGSIATAFPGAQRYVSVYGSLQCGGNADVLLGRYYLQADANGVIDLNLSIPNPNFGPVYVTAFANDYTAGVTNTSEVSNSKPLSAVDDIFNDTFDCY